MAAVDRRQRVTDTGSALAGGGGLSGGLGAALGIPGLGGGGGGGAGGISGAFNSLFQANAASRAAQPNPFLFRQLSDPAFGGFAGGETRAQIPGIGPSEGLRNSEQQRVLEDQLRRQKQQAALQFIGGLFGG